MLTDDEIRERIADTYGSQLASCELLLALAQRLLPSVDAEKRRWIEFVLRTSS